jgi:WD40 repeat protein
MSTATAHALLWQTRIDDVPVALSVAGGRLAVAGAEGTCVVLDPETGEAGPPLTHEGGLLDAALSPDGVHLALSGPAGYEIQSTTDRRSVVFDSGGWCARARWSGTDRVAVAFGRRVLVHAVDGSTLWRTNPAPSTITDLTWLRDGREVGVAAYHGVYRYARHAADPVGHLRYPGSHLAVAASPNSRWICTGNQDRSVHIWRTRDNEELEMAGFPEKVTALAFDPTGRWLANNGATEATVWDFAGKGPAGRTPRMLRCHDAVTALAWRPGTGAILATGGSDATAAVWRADKAAPGAPTRPAQRFDLDSPATAIAWIGDRSVAVATRTGSVHAFDVIQT